MAHVPTHREHRATRRTLRATLRLRAAATRTLRKATRALASGQPQTAKTHLIGRGLDPTTAKRFAGAFSKGVTPTATSETVIKLKGRARKAVAVKLYDSAAFMARLRVYRPKSPTAAAAFAALAA
ncbi:MULTISPECIES: hypothetical protein [Streptomyces]|uniref:50S ribosomal protein L22 n=1 Tax=Streptomyces dengpaensis TaxID=2049881 RepID=A0ABM6STQ3_9ACTN|nr:MULTISPECIES: hypothetical protein [Streptomyces]AVH57798.1 hypothetical protein C4B68_20750 [Streptomyces dengpaensis]PIA98563.1 hypothetical protein B1C81_39450 [Streptomyces sp. HG99]